MPQRPEPEYDSGTRIAALAVIIIVGSLIVIPIVRDFFLALLDIRPLLAQCLPASPVFQLSSNEGQGALDRSLELERPQRALGGAVVVGRDSGCVFHSLAYHAFAC